MVDEFEGATSNLADAARHKEDLQGFAGVINVLLGILNKIPRFKEQYASTDLKFLLVATDLFPAALVHVDHGVVKFSAVPKEKIRKWKMTGANGMLQCRTEQFLDIAIGKIEPAKAWIRRQIKIRGITTMMEFSRILGVGA